MLDKYISWLEQFQLYILAGYVYIYLLIAKGWVKAKAFLEKEDIYLFIIVLDLLDDFQFV